MTPRALASLLAALALAGCTVDTSPTLFLAGICGTPDDPAACLAPAGQCDTYLNGQLHTYESVLTAGGAYDNFLTAVAEVNNQATDNSDAGIGRVNTRDAIIESAKISYSSPGLAISPVEARDLFTPVRAAGTSTIFLPVMSSATVQQIVGLMPALTTSVDVIAHLKLAGHYVDGTTFETATFDIPSRVINAQFDATTPCADPTQVRVFCYYPGMTGNSACVTP